MREVGFVGGWRGQIKWTFKAEARCLKGPSSSLSRIAGIKRESFARTKRARLSGSQNSKMRGPNFRRAFSVSIYRLRGTV